MVQTLLAGLVCLILAYMISEFFRRFGLPRVVGQVGAGLLLSLLIMKYEIFTIEDFTILSFLADIGVILLFYYVGLETDFKAFTKNLNTSLLDSAFNTFLPLVGGFLVMRYLFHFELLPSVIIGVSLAVSAQSVSVDILEELKMLKSKIGNLIISIGAVDDMVELILVTILLSLVNFAGKAQSFSGLLIDVSIFILLVFVAKIWLIPFLLKVFRREHSSTSRFMGSVIIVFLMAFLSEILGVGVLIGAMITGMIVRQTIFKDVHVSNREEYDIARSTHIIAFGFLVPLFFVWIGLNVDLSLVATSLDLILAFVLIAFVGTIGGTMIATLIRGGTFKEGLILGWGLNPKGDVELVIASLALESGIITAQIFTALVLMSLITTIVSPIVFKRLVKS